MGDQSQIYKITGTILHLKQYIWCHITQSMSETSLQDNMVSYTGNTVASKTSCFTL